MAKVLVLYYSMYGHIYRMAQAVAEGAKEVPGTDVTLRRVPDSIQPRSNPSILYRNRTFSGTMKLRAVNWNSKRFFPAGNVAAGPVKPENGTAGPESTEMLSISTGGERGFGLIFSGSMRITPLAVGNQISPCRVFQPAG